MASSTAPIFRLPAEILGEIFYRHLEEIFHRHMGEADTMSPNRFNLKEPKELEILTLGKVCVRWSQTAHSDPKLWSLISLDFTSKGLTEKQTMNVLNVHLRRSRTHPLTLRLKGSTNSGCARVAERVIVRLLQYSHRWLRASFTLPNNIWEDQHIWIWRPSEGFPILQELSIAGNDRQGRSIPHFKVTPCLRSVMLKGPALLPATPWIQISELTLSCVTFTSTITLIKSCSQLTRLTIDSCILPENPSFQVSHPFSLVFSNLEHLSIEKHYRDEPCTSVLAKLLPRLVLPRLKSLSVKAANEVRRPGPKGSWPHSEFVAFLRRSNSPITILKLKSPITSAEFWELISLVPTLETLIFEEQDVVSSPLVFNPALLHDRLTHLPDRKTLPRLSHLELVIVSYQDNRSLLDMLRSRCMPPYPQHTIPLRYVELRFINCPIPSPAFCSGLSELSRLSGLEYLISMRPAK